MGQLMYGTPSDLFELDDRTLAHVEIVTLAKLRRNESFALVIPNDSGGRVSLWISPVSTLQFRIGDVKQDIDREWLDQLIEGANSPGGLRVELKAEPKTDPKAAS